MLGNKKVSNFFTEEEALKYKGVMQTAESRDLSSIAYAAARLDLVKFTINKPIQIVKWFLDNQTANDEGEHELSLFRKGLAIEFKVEGNTLHAFELLKSKILGKNNIKISCAELLYNAVDGTITISFKRIIDIEKNKIGIKNGKQYTLQFMNGEKVEKKVFKKKPFNKGGFKKTFNKNFGGKRR